MFFKNNKHRTDEEMLRAISERDDRNAFEMLYNKYWEVLLNSCYKRLKSLETAEEIVQEVFTDFYLRRKEISPKTTIEAYLKTAIKFKVFNYFRAQQMHLTYLSSILEAEQIVQPMVENYLSNDDLMQSIERTLPLMPDKCREVFMLSKYNQLSQKEISEKLGISISTVKKHITRAHQILKINLGDRRHEF